MILVCLHAFTLYKIVFRYFGISCCVCIVLSSLYIYLVFLLSSGYSDLFPRIVFSQLLFAVLFSFSCKIFQCFSSVLSIVIIIITYKFLNRSSILFQQLARNSYQFRDNFFNYPVGLWRPIRAFTVSLIGFLLVTYVTVLDRLSLT